LVTKKYCWIWIAIDRIGKKFINCAFGSRGTETGIKLWDKLRDIDIKEVMTDHWKAYTIEGYNSIFMHFLARLRRKSKCYTKSLEMLRYSVLLLMKYRNKELAIFN
jgi:insertion element IS1 protein InsB